MRNSLNIYEQIDDFLSNAMSAEEHTDFQNKINSNPELQQLLESQQLLIQAQQRKVLRAEIETIAKSGGFPYGKVFGGIGVILVAVLMYLLIGNNNNETKEVAILPVEKENTGAVIKNLPDSSINEVTVDSTEFVDSIVPKPNRNYSYSEDTDCGGHKTWVEPDRQKFTFNPQKGKTIEGKEGMLIIIPTNAFVDNHGDVVKSTIELELVEALTLEDMVLYDLATMSDEKQLESGGMFYLNAKSQGENVQINPERPFYIEIPTNEVKPGMMAFTGEVDEEGKLNWVEPKPLKKYLVKMDLDKLDFLPEGFDEGVANGMPFKNHSKATDVLVDSLYYSLGGVEEIKDEVSVIKSVSNQETIIERTVEYKGSKTKLKDVVLPVGFSNVNGRIIGCNDQPIANVSAFISSNNKVSRSNIWTDSKGKFKIKNVKYGEYILYLSKTGFKVYTDTITVSKLSKEDLGDIVLELDTNWKPSYDFAVIDGGGTISLPRKTIETFDIEGKSSKTGEFCGVNPLSVKTIRTKNFANTFVATKEFEERIAVLHKLNNGQELLDVYLSNLGADLYFSDSIVMTKVKGDFKKVFTNYYKQKLTNLKDAEIHQEQLSAYYNKKRKEFARSVQKLRNQLAKKDKEEIAALRSQLDAARGNYTKTLSLNTPVVKGSPFAGNTSTAIANLVSKLPKTNVVIAPRTYSMPWTTFGWGNIDSYLHLLSKGSEDVKILAQNADENIQIYQWLNTINTLTPLSISNNAATAKFPKRGTAGAGKMRNTFCFAISKKNGKLKWSQNKFTPYRSNNLVANLQPASEKEIRRNLRLLGVKEDRVLNHVDRVEKALIKAQKEKEKRERKVAEIKAAKEAYIAKSKEVDAKIKEINARREAVRVFIEGLMDIAFPCRESSDELSADFTMEAEGDVNEVYTIVEKIPEFPEGQEALYQFLASNISYPKVAFENGVEGAVYVQFVVKGDGTISGAKIIKGVHPLLDAEALRVIKLLPKFTPGNQRGKAVDVFLTLPIRFYMQ